jgi:hypothetical protein
MIHAEIARSCDYLCGSCDIGVYGLWLFERGSGISDREPIGGNRNPRRAAPTDSVMFKATGNYAAYDVGYYGPNAKAACTARISDSSQTLTQVTWSTSDSINTSIDANGIATCLGTTTSPATITALASGICGGEKAKATLTWIQNSSDAFAQRQAPQ